jgi:(p)ppGpp synthase/HD superfamily hydrolase
MKRIPVGSVLETDIQKAHRIAQACHEEQVDKNGEPYINHPKRVSKRLGRTDDQIVALLHDVVEDFFDRSLISDVLRHNFSSDICRSIEAISIRKGESREDYYQRVIFNKCARRVKIQDIFDNLDPDRLDKLHAKVRMRLKKKYLKALDYLL